MAIVDFCDHTGQVIPSVYSRVRDPPSWAPLQLPLFLVIGIIFCVYQARHLWVLFTLHPHSSPTSHQWSISHNSAFSHYDNLPWLLTFPTINLIQPPSQLKDPLVKTSTVASWLLFFAILMLQPNPLSVHNISHFLIHPALWWRSVYWVPTICGSLC